jgi:hypothetical protein
MPQRPGDRVTSRFSQTEDYAQLAVLYNRLKKDHGMSLLDLTEALGGTQVPCSIFNARLTVLQSLVKYLSEKGEKSGDIARTLQMTTSGVWRVLRDAKKLLPSPSLVADSILVPISLFKEGGLSATESLVAHLKERHGLRYRAIGGMLQRDERTIWTIYRRAVKKRA